MQRTTIREVQWSVILSNSGKFIGIEISLAYTIKIALTQQPLIVGDRFLACSAN
jgi:hypothetical protein